VGPIQCSHLPPCAIIRHCVNIVVMLLYIVLTLCQHCVLETVETHTHVKSGVQIFAARHYSIESQLTEQLAHLQASPVSQKSSENVTGQ